MSSTATRLARLAFNSALTASSILFLSLAVNKLKPEAQKHVLSFQLYKWMYAGHTPSLLWRKNLTLIVENSSHDTYRLIPVRWRSPSFSSTTFLYQLWLTFPSPLIPGLAVFQLSYLNSKFLAATESTAFIFIRRHGTEHNDIQHNNTQHNYTQHDDTQYISFRLKPFLWAHLREKKINTFRK